MGFGVVLKCSDCHEEENLMLGSGFSDFMNGYTNVVCVCKRCGNWKAKEVKFDFPEILPEDNLEKEIVPKDDTDKEMCPFCKIRMKQYKDYYSARGKVLIPKITCKKCGGLLQADRSFCWD